MIKILIPLFLLSAGFTHATAKKDSIGLEMQAGKYYILHKVEPKETLFSLSRRYHVAVEEILSSNPDAKDGLRTASVVKIPTSSKQPVVTTGRKHVVRQSETLFSIAKAYNVDMEKIVSANRMTDRSLRVGQELIIPSGNSSVETNQPMNDPSRLYHTVAAGETLFSLSRQYRVEVDQIRRWNNLPDNSLKFGQVIIVGESTLRTTAEENKRNAATAAASVFSSDPEVSAQRPEISNTTTNPTVASSSPTVVEDVKKFRIDDNEYIKNKTTSSQSLNIDKVYESGFAELIEGTGDTKKYLALHKTAPVGTIMQVKNEMNDLSVFVRVIGKLPDTGENDKIRIRLSKMAYDHLGALDPRFPVEISYNKR